MQFKVAILLVGLVALASSKPAAKAPRGLVGTVGQVILGVNQVVADLLDEANQAIETVQGNVDQIGDDAEALAASLIAAARQAIDDELEKILGQVNEDAGKLVQCALDQQDNVDAAVQAAANAVIESVTGNLNGIGDGLVPLVADLQAQNQALREVETHLPECDGAEDEDTCALNVMQEVLDVLANIPTEIQGSLDAALAAAQAAGEHIADDTRSVLAELQDAALQILDDVGTCASA